MSATKVFVRFSNQNGVVTQLWVNPTASKSFSTSSQNEAESRESKIQPRKRSGKLQDGINLANMKRGTGYRSSFSGQVATVFGATGMIGRGVCNRFGKNGTQMIIPYRGDFYDAQRLKVCGDLGQVMFTPYDMKDEDSIRLAMKYSDVVVNLVGREYETRNYKFKDVNVTVPAKLARIAKEMGVSRFIHISSINASDNPQSLFMPGGSPWLKTKREGERAVLKEFPDATIFRPCEMYGHADHLVNYYNAFFRKSLIPSYLAMWKKGRETVRSPLQKDNLTDGIMAALADPATKGITFEAMGPEKFCQYDLIRWMYEVMHKDPKDYFFKLKDLRFDPSTFVKAGIMSYWPFGLGLRYWRAPTLERLERSQLNEVSEGLPNLTDLGVKLWRVEERMPFELEFYRAFKYHKYLNEDYIPVVNPLVPLTQSEAKAIVAKSGHGKEILKVLGV